MRATAVAALLAAACVALGARAQPVPVGTCADGRPAPNLQRPRVGLVLSGGGARGGAHLGVLKVLEELHVPVDVVVGTSAGAIVAAAYASGAPLQEIEREMGELHTAMLFRDVDRTETPLRNKANDAINFLGPEVGVNRGVVSLPKGVVAGVSIEAVLRHLTHRQRTPCFDRLPIAFRAIATDLTSSQMVVLDHGDLAVALRASMAIPAVLEPVELDGRLLVDGGLSRNLPVDVARQMGAEVLIAVNVGTPLRTRDEITGFLTVSDQITRILTNTNVKQSLSELGPDDLLITPDLGGVGSGDFDLLGLAAVAGEQAARDAVAGLRRFSIDAAAYAAWREALGGSPPQEPVRIDSVQVTGTNRVNPQVIAASITTKAGDDFDPRAVDEDMKRIYARGDFEHVSYTLSDDPAAGRVLTADVVEKSWGPNYVRFGLGLSSDLHGDSYFSLVAMHRATWLNPLGGEWRNDAQIGHTDRFASEFYQPLTPAQRLFVAAHVETAREPFDVYDDQGNRLASYRRATYGVGVDLGSPLGNLGELRLGAYRGRLKFVDDTTSTPGTLLVPPTQMAGLTARLRVDTLDNLRFPRSGYDADVLLYSSRQRLGATDEYTKLSASLGAAMAVESHSVQVQVRGATSLGSFALPAYELFTLGGFLELSGYNTDQLVGRALNFGRIVYTYRVSAPGLLDGAYLGTSVEAGRIGDAVTGSERSSARYGSSVFFALDSPLGPVYLAYGHGDGKNQAVYFFLGRP